MAELYHRSYVQLRPVVDYIVQQHLNVIVTEHLEPTGHETWAHIVLTP